MPARGKRPYDRALIVLFGVLRTLVPLVGAVAWGAYVGRLLRRSLHMLQLEAYQTVRFLRWSAAARERWARDDRAILALAGVALGARLTPWPPSRVGKGETKTIPHSHAGTRASGSGLLAWAAIGAYLWRGAVFGQAKKPLVLTARAKRLLAGEAVIGLAVGAGPAAVLALRGARALPALVIGASAASLTTPLVAATANLLLWPIEEAFRRYYLGDARRLLRRYRPTVVGVAGSYGKTSTKEFLAAILATRWSVLKPPGSHNTPMGLSRVIREQLEPRHELFVAELGDYVPGDIRNLCGLLGPRIGVLTTIGPEHLERFGTIERVVQTKQELLDALPADGVAIVNRDDPLVRGLADRARERGLRVVTFGRQPGADVRADEVRTTREGLAFAVVTEGHGRASFEVGVLGRHNVANVLAATAVALELGMSLEEIAVAARRIAPVEHRLQPIRGEGGVLVIDDTFNANPRGAAEALRVLGELNGGRRVLVTPGMVELAEQEFERNRELGRNAARVCDQVILVGQERARPILAGLRDAGYPEGQTHVVRTLTEATDRLRGLLARGDIVLFENDLPDTYEPADMGRQSALNGRATNPLSLWERVRVGATPAPRSLPKPDASRRRASLEHDSSDRVSSPRPEGEGTSLPSVVVQGVRIAYRASGKDTGRLPVVVLHGWGASSAAVASIQACLQGEYRTIAPDLPGFGLSDPPPVAWGHVEYAATIRQLLRQLGIERAAFIGHSRGGAISILLAATVPELVDRLVLVDSAGLRARHGRAYRARVLAFKAPRRAARVLPAAGRWLERRFGSEDYRQAGPMRGTLVRLVNDDLRAFLPRIQVPTLLIWGEHDDATPLANAQVMERLIPDAGLVIFSGAGHFAYADDPGRFCRVVGHFLKA